MSAHAPDVLVVGAGIVGAWCAAEFAREGLRVAVVDQAGIGQGATAAGMGHVVVMDDSEPQFELCRLSQRTWRDAAAEMPADVEWREAGTLWVAADESEMAECQRKRRFLADHGLSAEPLDAAMLAEAEPNLRPGLAGGLLQPSDAVLYAPCAARWLLQQSRADVRLHATVSTVRTGAVKIADGPEIHAGLIVLATGDTVAQFAPDVPMRRRKGHLAITDRYPGFVRHQLVEMGYVKSATGEAAESVAFNVQPRATGQVLIGSSRQYGADSPDVEAAVLARMLRRGIEYMPGLAQLSIIRTWTGFRASTPDKLPIIGPHPAMDGVWLATGHEGLGITMAPGTAGVLVAAALGKAPPIPMEPYLPKRFAEAKPCVMQSL